MSSQPSQLFDFSSQLARQLYAQDKGAAPDGGDLQTPPDLFGEDDEAFARFDWEKFGRDFAASMPPEKRDSFSAERFHREAALQSWLGQRLPPTAIRFLVEQASARGLWYWLTTKPRAELKRDALRGFQQTPPILKHPVVRARLAAYFEKNRLHIIMPLIYYGTKDPPPPLVAMLQSEQSALIIRHRLPSILREFGLDETLCALAFCRRVHVFKSTWDLIRDPEALHAKIAEAEPIPAPIAVPAPPSEPDTENPKPDSEIAEVYKKLYESTLEELENSRALGGTLTGMMTGQAEALKGALAETQLVKARENNLATQSAKKFANLEARLGGELEELRKHDERQGRRLRALERDHEELETENRRLKKQLRHTQSLLEDERKIASSPVSAPPASDVAASFEALAGARMTQSAPNKPVVVSSPTPLDEIFEWRADGRAIRVTAREVKRLIDRNDEDATWQIMLALESLETSDKDKRHKFLHRLKGVDGYYARVLTQSTTRVLVDASNVARAMPNRYGKGQLVHLERIRDELRRRNCWPLVFISDASLPYNIDEPAKVREMARAGELILTDKGVEADEVLTREARKTGAYVVTNDAKFWMKVSPDFEPPRITFRAYPDAIIVDEF